MPTGKYFLPRLNYRFNKDGCHKNKKKYIDNLGKAVAIKSVSAWPETREEITTMMTWMGEELKGLGASIEYVDIGSQTLPDGQVRTQN